MSNFRNNYSEFLLLANQNISFVKNDGTFSFELVPMKVKDLFFNENLIWLIDFLQKDIDDFSNAFENYTIKSHFDFIRLIISLGSVSEFTQELSDRIVNGLKCIIPEINIENKFLMIKKEFVSSELFEQIIKIVFRIMHKKEPVKIVDSDDEMTRKMKATQKRIQDIKNKGKKINENSTKFEDIFAALLYEYPQYKMEDLFELNIYTFYYLFKYVGKIANYEVSKIAAGNGLTKKHKYFIEK